MKIELSISGMSCAHCVNHVKNAALDVEGVKDAQVSLEENKAIVDFEAPATKEKIIDSIVDAGYEAK